MSDKNPEFMLRDRNTGRIFGVNPVQELMPNMEKVRFEDVYPEKCMPEHVKKKIAAKKPAAKKPAAKKAAAKKPAVAKKANAKKTAATKAPKKKAGLDLSTPEEDIPKDPDEVGAEGGDDLDAEIQAALGDDASRGLNK